MNGQKMWTKKEMDCIYFLFIELTKIRIRDFKLQIHCFNFEESVNDSEKIVDSDGNISKEIMARCCNNI